MIEKILDKTYIVCCDNCSNYEEFEDVEDWDHLMKLLKQAGWYFVKNKGLNKWEHFCPVCKEV